LRPKNSASTISAVLLFQPVTRMKSWYAATAWSISIIEAGGIARVTAIELLLRGLTRYETLNDDARDRRHVPGDPRGAIRLSTTTRAWTPASRQTIARHAPAAGPHDHR
jgi:hypothetical protein